MTDKSFWRASVAFHMTLGVVVFLQSADAVHFALSGGVAGTLRTHMTILASVEAVGALLFLIPKTARWGGGILIVVFAIALLVHGILHGLPLLVYAAGVILVMAQGGSYTKGMRNSDT